MADKFYYEKLIPDIERKSVGEYLGNKIQRLSGLQIVAVVKHIRAIISEENYEALLGQCGIRYVATKSFEAA